MLCTSESTGYLHAVLGGPDTVLTLLRMEKQLMLLQTCSEGIRILFFAFGIIDILWYYLPLAPLPSFLFRLDAIRRPAQFSSMPCKLRGI
jgi:hypothetical protein